MITSVTKVETEDDSLVKLTQEFSYTKKVKHEPTRSHDKATLEESFNNVTRNSLNVSLENFIDTLDSSV
jgi:hypothetical protein